MTQPITTNARNSEEFQALELVAGVGFDTVETVDRLPLAA
jgi:hypothetical protein